MMDAEVAALGIPGHEGWCDKLTMCNLASFLANASVKAWGAATVASTMRSAQAASVDVLATSGTGGIHQTLLGEGEGQDHDKVLASIFLLCQEQ